jgi:hypothetical protein
MIPCLEDSALDSGFDDFVTALNNRPKPRRTASYGVAVTLPAGSTAMGKVSNF